MSKARLLTLSGLLAFIGGFIDVVCFFGLKGLLAAHITGNLATLCASIVLGTAGLVSKIVAVPEFMIIAALAHMTARMGVQNAVQRAQLTHIPPTSFMTGNATQASIDVVDALAGAADAAQKTRLKFVVLNLSCFAIGCAAAALSYDATGFMALVLTVPVAILAAVLAPAAG